jgi:hypothetical protein
MLRQSGPAAMRYWWVNQNQTFRHQLAGGCLWSPKRNANGARNPFYEFMREVSPGDVIFSFIDTSVAAIGIAQSYCWESRLVEADNGWVRSARRTIACCASCSSKPRFAHASSPPKYGEPSAASRDCDEWFDRERRTALDPAPGSRRVSASLDNAGAVMEGTRG